MDVLKVLLVEDCCDVAETLARVLTHSDPHRFSVTICGTLADAIDALRRQPIDVILLDLTLPDSEGLGTIHAIQEVVPKTAIVVLTGMDDEKLAIEATSHGVQDYLVKGQIDYQLISRALFYAVHRMRTELIVAEQRYRHQMVLEMIPDVRIYFKDLQGRFVEVNPALASLYNYPDPQSMVGKSDYDLFSAEHAAKAARDESEVVHSGRPIIGKVERETHPDGTVSWAISTKMPLRDAAGAMIGTFGVSRDVTALKRTEEQLREANANLSRALEEVVKSHQELKATQLQLIQAEKLRSLGQMAASVAHEIKNPMAILRVGLEYLIENCAADDEQQRAVVQELEAALTRGDVIIRDLLNYSASSDLALQSHDLNDLVHRTLRFVRHELNKGKIKTELELPDGLPPCELDPTRFEQVMINLITNACHAMPSGGVLRIRTGFQICAQGDGAPPPDRPADRSGIFKMGRKLVALEIEDSGSGIPEEKLQRVFDPFYTTKADGAGTGLGLAVVKRIVDLHGGHIELANKKTGGLKATILLRAKNGATTG